MDMDCIAADTPAEDIVAALPYVAAYSGKTIVVKYGGNAMTTRELKETVMGDIILLARVGIKVALVHGGGPEITNMLARLGMESRFINGLRYTDADTIDVVQMMLAGKTNKDLVALIGLLGGKAMGMCGIDGRMLQVRKLASDPDLGYVGEIVHVEAEPIITVLSSGYIPVIATVGVDYAGAAYNINADTAASEIAVALGAESMITLTDTRGVMNDVNDPNSIIPSVRVDEVAGLIARGVVSGGMIPKVQSCESAVRGGVAKAVMIDGRMPHSILLEMFSDEGIGTMFIK
jgi:acetylglutamate kinase